jgi:hypothetical protein
MLNTLKAVVHGDRIHWQEAVDDLVHPDRPVEVLVTILPQEDSNVSTEERGRRRVAALQKIAASNAFSEIQDPTEWQRQAREDRDLPGREQ